MPMPIRWQIHHAVCEAYAAKDVSSNPHVHGHHCFLLTLITRGEGVQTLNGKDIPFAPGDLFLLSPADFHKNTVSPGETFDYLGVKFPYELLDSLLSEYCSPESFPLYVRLPETTFPLIRRAFEQLILEYEQKHDCLGHPACLHALLQYLFILVLREFPLGAPVRSDAFINRSLGYLHSHFHESISVRDAAAYTGYTPNYFSSRFRELTGLSFTQYLRKMRLNYAENLLRSGNTPITEIALESGFISLPHFSRCFHEEFGLSPMDYRKQKEELT